MCVRFTSPDDHAVWVYAYTSLSSLERNNQSGGWFAEAVPQGKLVQAKSGILQDLAPCQHGTWKVEVLAADAERHIQSDFTPLAVALFACRAQSKI